MALAGGVALTSIWVFSNLLEPALAGATTAAADTTTRLLQAIGIGAHAHAAVVVDEVSGFAFTISPRCTGVLLAAIWFAAGLALAPSLRKSGPALALGAVALLLLNLVRLVSLFAIGVHAPGWFDLAHRVVWELLLVAAMAGLGWHFLLRSWPARAASA